MIYMSTRLVVNVSQVYLPMFITETVKLDKVRDYISSGFDVIYSSQWCYLFFLNFLSICIASQCVILRAHEHYVLDDIFIQKLL